MAVIDIFLNKLQVLINAADNVKVQKAINRNSCLEIENVLYSNKITGEVSYEDLLTLKKEDLRTIFKAMFGDNFESEYNKFMSKRAIILEFRNVSLVHVNAFEPKEYSSAMDYVSIFSERLNVFIKNNKSDIKYGNSELYKKYLNMFRGSKLVTPVTNFDEFDELLLSMKFNDKEQSDIKYYIGIGNIDLLLPQDTNEISVLNKYEVILKNKYEKYKDIISLLKKENFNLNDFDDKLSDISNRLSLDKDDLRQAMCTILLGKKIAEYKDVSNKDDMPKNIKTEYLDNLKNELDKVIDKSRNKAVEEEKTEEVPRGEEVDVLDEVDKIIESEKALIDSINFDDLNSYLLDGIEEQSESTIGYRLASIITALYSESEKVKNFIDTPSVYNTCINSIKDYLYAYHKLKEEQKSYLLKKNKEARKG